MVTAVLPPLVEALIADATTDMSTSHSVVSAVESDLDMAGPRTPSVPSEEIPSAPASDHTQDAAKGAADNQTLDQSFDRTADSANAILDLLLPGVQPEAELTPADASKSPVVALTETAAEANAAQDLLPAQSTLEKKGKGKAVKPDRWKKFENNSPLLDLAIKATTTFRQGDIIPSLKGSLADLTEDQDNDLREDVNGLQSDFSVLFNPTRKVFQLLLGPARFCNVRRAASKVRQGKLKSR